MSPVVEVQPPSSAQNEYFGLRPQAAVRLENQIKEEHSNVPKPNYEALGVTSFISPRRRASPTEASGILKKAATRRKQAWCSNSLIRSRYRFKDNLRLRG
jgi:hypothetical protein